MTRKYQNPPLQTNQRHCEEVPQNKNSQKLSRNHANKITSVIAAKQTVINEVNVFSIKYRYSDILLKIQKLHLFC